MNKRLRTHAEKIFKAAVAAADPRHAVLAHLKREDGNLLAGRRRYDLSKFKNIWVIGAGKASASMAVAVEKLLGRQITGGLINVKDGHLAPLRRIQLNQASHPLPDQRGVDGTQRILAIAKNAGKQDLVICLISGGASALLPAPCPGLTLADKQLVTKHLLNCGATIHEINTVRKHLSLVKGGRLAAAVFPATLLTLVLSDVIGDDLDVIGSGPTVGDPSTFAQVHAILEKFQIAESIPASARKILFAALEETPKPGDTQFRRTQNLIVGSNRLAINAAAKTAKSLGYRPLVLSTTIEGETREVAALHTEIAREVRASAQPLRAPACILSGGETTVTIRGNGKGGRNQEFALAAAMRLNTVANAVILSAGTDGTDGPTDAAGAFAFTSTLSRAESAGLSAASALQNNDAYPFFDALGDLLKTGPTNTNVMDIRIVLLA